MDSFRRLLIVKLGTAPSELVARRGDFEDWIAAGMGLSPARVVVADVCAGAPLPEPRDFAGIVLTGSSAMVTDRESWSERTAVWLPSVVEAGTPLLGICYGHQLLVHALGGRVGTNPRGREIGTIDVDLGPARSAGDELLGALRERVRVQASHVESVLELAPGVRRLGWSIGDPHHAFRVGKSAWGVQFHPEFDADVMRGYVRHRSEIIRAEGLDPEALLRDIEDGPDGTSLLARFAHIAFRGGEEIRHSLFQSSQ
jgi:GMP synthase (glutamine-hydrolysing)